MANQLTNTETIDSRWNWLFKISGVVALIIGMLLLIGIVNLLASVLQSRSTNNLLSLLQNNWLVKIFVQHAGLSDIHADLLGLNVLDIIILLLVSIVCFSFSIIFKNAGKVWSTIAFVLSLIAIVLFVITQKAGRSTVMLAVLINSFAMIKDKTFSKAVAYMGIFASVFLFIGDLTVGIYSNAITILFGIGYILLIIWFFLIAKSLIRLRWMC